jgi:heme exporter protein A
MGNPTSSNAPDLRATDLECVRGDRVLFSELRFELRPGQLMAIEGANGAGKTSLLRIVAGLSPPSDGEVLWRNHRIDRRRADYCSEMIYLGHNGGLKMDLSPLENVKLWLTLAGSPLADPVIEDALAEAGLAGYQSAPTRILSAGQRQRTSLTRLLLRRVPLWILDEPFTALDAAGLKLVRWLLDRHAAGGGMAILTSHQPIEVSGQLRTLSLS